jgi:hypothetical protein
VKILLLSLPNSGLLRLAYYLIVKNSLFVMQYSYGSMSQKILKTNEKFWLVIGMHNILLMHTSTVYVKLA